MMQSHSLRHLLAPLCMMLALISCSDGGGGRDSQAQLMLKQFGTGALFFSESRMQALLDLEDKSSPVTLLQLITVDDSDGFARYEAQAASVWLQFSGQQTFASRSIGQLIGDRNLTEIRVLEFANAAMLIDAINSESFAVAMTTLFSASSDHAWVLGYPGLSLDLKGGFFDPALQGLNEEQAIALLAQNSSGSEQDSGFDSNSQLIVDMIVSDSPEPFYMVNLIDFYDQANYPDDRETDLTGEQANAVYGGFIGPQLLQRNSGPQITLPVSVVLTKESRQWQQAVIVRYASRDAFLNIFPLNPNAGDALIHKEAGVEETLVYVSERRHASPPQPVSGAIFNLRYCEILLVTLGANLSADIWGTPGLNLCPQQDWDAINSASIAAQYGVPVAIKNGPRFFVADWISNTQGLAGGEAKLFGDIAMRLLTTVQPAIGGSLDDTSYRVNRVARDNIWHFVAGRRVYELTDPDGTRYMMQSFSQIVDPELTLEALTTLDERLQLPEGWSFSTRVLTNSFELPAIEGVAEVIQDNLDNTYQRVP